MGNKIKNYWKMVENLVRLASPAVVKQEKVFDMDNT